ncbi:MAG: cyanophycinase [Myxococcota bacterium]
MHEPHWQATPAGPTPKRLVLFGGGPRPPQAMKQFVSWAGGTNARIVVITWAAQEPALAHAALASDLALWDPAEIRDAPLSPRRPQARAELVHALSTATGVFFSGGDQNRIMDVLGDPELLTLMRQRYAAGVTFGGTSAGTAVMSSVMISGDGDPSLLCARQGVTTRGGLGLLPGCVVDQHFLKRRRQNRLFGLVLEHEHLLGVGVDEGTALAITDDRHARVVGPERVMVVDAQKHPGSLLVDLLRPGDRYDLRARHRVASAVQHRQHGHNHGVEHVPLEAPPPVLELEVDS